MAEKLGVNYGFVNYCFCSTHRQLWPSHANDKNKNFLSLASAN